MPDELFDVIDEDDNIIGQELRSVVHQRGLWHRGVHVFLFTPQGKLIVQQRNKDRQQAPLALDCSVSEHVVAGEDYHTAALRGLKEELGVTGIVIQPVLKFKMKYGPNDNEVSLLYQGMVESAAVTHDPGEIENIFYFDRDELVKLLAKGEPAFSYWFEQIFAWYEGYPSALQVLFEYQTPRLFQPLL